MIEPIILSKAIVDQAKKWREESVIYWSDNEELTSIGEANISSPVDNSERKVRFSVGGWTASSGEGARAIVFLPNSIPQLRQDGFYNIILNRFRRPQIAHLHLATILHEITHTVDPAFPADVATKAQSNPPLDAYGQYQLRSEQTAFTAMWIDDLREQLAKSPNLRVNVLIDFWRKESREFDGFYSYAQLRGDAPLRDQIHDHFKKMIVAVKAETP